MYKVIYSLTNSELVLSLFLQVANILSILAWESAADLGHCTCWQDNPDGLAQVSPDESCQLPVDCVSVSSVRKASSEIANCPCHSSNRS